MCPEMDIEVIVGAKGLSTVTTLPRSKNFQFHFVRDFFSFICNNKNTKSDTFLHTRKQYRLDVSLEI